MYRVEISYDTDRSTWYFDSKDMATDFAIGSYRRILVEDYKMSLDSLPAFTSIDATYEYITQLFQTFISDSTLREMLVKHLGVQDIWEIYPPTIDIREVKPNRKTRLDVSVFNLMQNGYMSKRTLGTEASKYNWSTEQ